jgi:hypothetical protein
MEKTDQNFIEQDDHLLTEELDGNEHALTLKFTIGFNSSMTGGVHNLTQNKKKQIFYSSAHTGVIYNYESGEQILLQGHVS